MFMIVFQLFFVLAAYSSSSRWSGRGQKKTRWNAGQCRWVPWSCVAYTRGPANTFWCGPKNIFKNSRPEHFM